MSCSSAMARGTDSRVVCRRRRRSQAVGPSCRQFVSPGVGVKAAAGIGPTLPEPSPSGQITVLVGRGLADVVPYARLHRSPPGGLRTGDALSPRFNPVIRTKEESPAAQRTRSPILRRTTAASAQITACGLRSATDGLRSEASGPFDKCIESARVTVAEIALMRIDCSRPG